MSMPESIPDFDLYAALGVAPGADGEAVRMAHREAVRLAHPDVLPDGDADDDEAKRLNIARDWLTDPERRARYDRSRGLRPGGAGAGQRPSRSEATSTDQAAVSTEDGVVPGPGLADAFGCLEVGWWILLLAFAAMVLGLALLIAADL